MKKYKSFDMLKILSFERIGGSLDELKAANMIIAECEKCGVNAVIEEFEVDGPSDIEASLEVLEPAYKKYTVNGVGMTGSATVEGDFLYITNFTDVDFVDARGKIVLINSRLPLKMYKKLIDAKVAGYIQMSGSIYDKESETDLSVNTMRKPLYDNGKIPGVTLRIKDAEKLVLSNPKKLRLTIKQKEEKVTSRNVCATIEGTKYKDEIIAFTAHYDSVKFSKGTYDNATGTTTILEALHYFTEHKPLRTLKFIWCGSEEKGLLGSKAYTNAHKVELIDYKLCINVDMTGVILGYDIACCTSEQSLVNYIDYLGHIEGFSIKSYQGVYSSDSTPFADNGVPSVSFARLSPAGGAEIHSRRDIYAHIDPKNYYETCNFINLFASNIINSKAFPIAKTIPDNMKEELDYYNLRKERK